MAHTVSAERIIPAEPQRIFDLLADPAMHPVLDGSGSVRQALPGNPERLSLGAQFGMSMKMGVPYRIKNTVIEFEEGRRIAWRHAGRHIWRYELEPVTGGTRVVETWDYSPLGPGARLMELLGFPKRNQAAMVKTLERLAEQVV